MHQEKETMQDEATDANAELLGSGTVKLMPTDKKWRWSRCTGGGYKATRTPINLPISQELIGVVESARGPAVRLPTMGGAVPLDVIERTLGTRTIVIPIANHDDNQHSFDENVRIQNLWDGIELMAALLTM